MKVWKKVLIIVLVLVLIGCAIGGYFIYRHNTMYISKDQALEIALDDAGLVVPDLKKHDIDFESTRYSAWYDVEFKTHTTEYDYTIDASTGAILSKNSKAD